jgi:hypothetical protein
MALQPVRGAVVELSVRPSVEPSRVATAVVVLISAALLFAL